jgi:hypothetical protein
MSRHREVSRSRDKAAANRFMNSILNFSSRPLSIFHEKRLPQSDLAQLGRVDQQAAKTCTLP